MYKILSVVVTVPSAAISSYVYYKSTQPQSNRLNIVFDLDDTLIYSERKKTTEQCNLNDFGSMRLPDLEAEKYCVWVRPYTGIVIGTLAKFNNISLMTRATTRYSDSILTGLHIDKFFTHKKYRQDCDEVCKNISKIYQDIDKTILVDDLRSNCCENHGQKLYHIPRYNPYNIFDIEMLKFFGFVLLANVIGHF
jgi:TFIIF-interacting CTD phosphatase-like protein